jgi:long-subunit acyl-CoA synthetase (AMP-forming)
MPRIALPLAPPIDAPRWDDIVAQTEPLAESPTREPEEIATIVYTSGSTGTPKGVMIDFRAMTVTGAGVADVIHTTAEDRMLSYLPLAHVFERWIVEAHSCVYGFRIFFAESLDTFVADLRRARPTLFISVPRLWLKFQAGVFKKMPPGKLALFLKIPILSGIVSKKVLTGLGLQDVRYAGSGSAPIPPELIQWYRDLGLELLEGYGMSENFSYSHASVPGKTRVGYVGNCYPGVEQRISDTGEIEIKSPGTMRGYYKEPELTRETFTEDGFLKTGDRGEIDEAGRLRITGRVKELFKTSKGKYVAPAPIENKLLTHAAVEQACVSGSGFPQPYALVMLSEEARAEVADPARRAALDAGLRRLLTGVNENLAAYEKLRCLVVVRDTWDIENGFLTPTMKMKRAVFEETYGPHAEAWCATREPVVWQE